MFDISKYSREQLYRLREIIEKAVESLDDETAVEGTTLFPIWKEGKEYTVGTRVKYEDVLYSVLQDHTSQAGWTPDASASLFAKVLIPDSNVVPEWEQPNSTNPYMTGDKVSHNDKTWVSSVDNNVWEPGAYGWNEVTE